MKTKIPQNHKHNSYQLCYLNCHPIVLLVSALMPIIIVSTGVLVNKLFGMVVNEEFHAI